MRNIKRQLTRKHRSGNGTAIVGLRFRKLISWLLILVFSTSPLQASVAMHIDLNDPVQDNQVLIEQSRETAFVNDTQNCVANFCQVFSACAAHLNCNPIGSSSPLQLDAQAQLFYHRLIVDESVLTRFPGLLKRPPRSWSSTCS